MLNLFYPCNVVLRSSYFRVAGGTLPTFKSHRFKLSVDLFTVVICDETGQIHPLGFQPEDLY